MHTLALILSRSVLAALGIIEICMLVRAILSFFVDQENVLLTFCIAVTEPVVVPFRVILSRVRGIDEMPLDIPFIVTYLAINLLGLLLPTVT